MSLGQPNKWNASLYDARLGFVSGFGRDVVDLLEPAEGERVLDLGCGTGDLTQAIAERGAVTLGIDSSADMIARARVKYPDLAFETADAETYRAAETFDAVFSNAALHWMKRPGDVLRGVRHALRPGGRFVAEFGAKGNVGAIVRAVEQEVSRYGVDPAERNPWYFPSIGEYAGLLEEEGFDVRLAAVFDRPTPLEDGESGLFHWLDMFAGMFFTGLSERQRRNAYDRIASALEGELFRDGRWIADYRRIRIVAVSTNAIK